MTAEAIAKATGSAIVETPLLRERRFGLWDGLFFEEIERKYPQEYLAWKRDPAGYAPEGGETMYDLLMRVKQGVAEMLERYRHRSLVVASHVGPIRLCIADALGLPPAMYRQLTIDYGSISAIDYGRTQNNLLYCNVSSRVLEGNG